MCPLELTFNDTKIFENKSPGDSQKCRPLYIEYTKETKEQTKNLYEIFSNEFTNTTLYSEITSKFDQKVIRFSTTLSAMSTMFDGKCINAIVGNNATTRCRCCKETNKDYCGK